MSKFIYSGQADIGVDREINEDFINVIELDDDVTFALLADGSGSLPSSLQPAAIACSEIEQIVRRLYELDKELFLDNITIFLTEALFSANRVLGAFKLGNEEKYSGFATSLTCCILYRNNQFAFAHTGNTRLYLIRTSNQKTVMKQLTTDHTKAKELLNKGFISQEQYYGSPDRLTLTGGLGVVADPPIQVFNASIKDDDILVLTSDGIHYAIRQDPMMQIIVQSENCELASKNLIEAAKMLKYNDNMSAIILYTPNITN